jgi:hypothetical protein
MLRFEALLPFHCGVAWGGRGQGPTVDGAQLFISPDPGHAVIALGCLINFFVSWHSDLNNNRDQRYRRLCSSSSFRQAATRAFSKHLVDFRCFLGSQILNGAEVKLMNDRIGLLQNMLQRIKLDSVFLQ